MPRKTTTQQKLFVTIDRDTLDDAVFNGVQEMIDTASLPFSHRQKLRVADEIATGVMKLIDAEATVLPYAQRAKRKSKVVPKDAKTAPLPGVPPLPPADMTMAPAPFGGPSPAAMKRVPHSA
jgi:hypothetical protein